MKYFLLFILITLACHGFSQKSLISYEDIKYLLNNNIQQADTFLTAKGYLITKKDNNTKNRKHALTLNGDTHNVISLRVDGRRLFIEIETNELNQYNLVRESISQYLIKDGMVADIQTYSVKELGKVYINVNESVPYDPPKKNMTYRWWVISI